MFVRNLTNTDTKKPADIEPTGEESDPQREHPAKTERETGEGAEEKPPAPLLYHTKEDKYNDE